MTFVQRFELHSLPQRLGRWDTTHRFVRRTVLLQELTARRYDRRDNGTRYVGPLFTSSFGCMAMLDTIAKQDIAGGSKTIVLVDLSRVANQVYLGLWREYFDFVDDPNEAARLSLDANLRAVFPHTWRAPDGRLSHFIEAAISIEGWWEQEGRDPLLHLSPEAVESGREKLATLGIGGNEWFVVLHVRTEARWDRLRNADISTYTRAVRRVTERGGWVVTVGERSVTSLPRIDGVVDYAHSDARTDAFDLFLLAKARFLIGTESGPAGVAGTFGTPVVATNWLLQHRNWCANHLVITKLYRRRRDNRLLPLVEALASPVGFAMDPSVLARRGVDVVDNSAEEIEEAVVEMIDRLDGRVSYTAQDDELQQRFHESQPRLRFPLPRPRARFGRAFTQRHADLLL